MVSPANSPFQIQAQDGPARTGLLTTAHGRIKTPAFVPVATQGAVRPLSAAHLTDLGVQVLITNAYHLHLQPGEGIIQNIGGLHRFMGWTGPLMMDSGGFQVFSLGVAKERGGSKTGKKNPTRPDLQKRSLVRINEEGADFISYRDGSSHRFTPEQVVATGKALGVDMMMVLDECTSPFHTYEQTREAMERTHRWSLRSLEEFNRYPENGLSLFGVVQGGSFQKLREESAAFIALQPFQGFAIGGFLGTSSEERNQILQWTIPHLPPDRPRHFLGLGLVDDVFAMVAHGVDLFDCIAPTLMASNGVFLSRNDPSFRIRILNRIQKEDSRPVEEGCGCYTCLHHSRAYLRHLFMVKEPLAPVLAAVHNLHFMESLLMEIRCSIEEKRFPLLREAWTKVPRPDHG